MAKIAQMDYILKGVKFRGVMERICGLNADLSCLTATVERKSRVVSISLDSFYP
jgi:hypothetical protein